MGDRMRCDPLGGSDRSRRGNRHDFGTALLTHHQRFAAREPSDAIGYALATHDDLTARDFDARPAVAAGHREDRPDHFDRGDACFDRPEPRSAGCDFEARATLRKMK
jgi:hypothetical protein